MRLRTVLALLASAASLPAADSLRAGLARAEISPSDSLPHPSGAMYGYTNRRCGTATGTHDPLFAKALVLAAGDTKLAIVTLDLGSFVSERVVREARATLGIQAVLLAASHTHSAPAFLGPQGGTSPYLEAVETKILETIKQAASNLFPARMAAGRGSLQLGYNRLLPRDDGRSRALFDNLERIPYGPVDPEYTVLRVDDEQGNAKAALIHYATHAVVLGPSNCKYSADYPGVLQSKLEADLPGVQAMFVQGGAGDINPLFMARSGDEEADFKVVQKLGETLAGVTLKAVREATPLPPAAPSIEFRTATFSFADRWEKAKSIDAGIATVLVNRQVAIATMPGEPMHKLQKDWKVAAEAGLPLFYGYTYTGTGVWAGYIPDLKTAAHGGYGADASTRVEIGAGERLLQRHVVHLYDLLGMWRAEPGRP
ncbi:MAG: neutral/alkaline non-lysosomal ceramidase N-terminal domain-containing protein [Bryobacteraceae bacterium]